MDDYFVKYLELGRDFERSHSDAVSAASGEVAEAVAR